MNRSTGFTIVEVMVTSAVIVTLLYSVPSFVEIIKNNRQTAQSNSLFFSLMNVREES